MEARQREPSPAPGVLITAIGSGQGKTTVVCAILQALKDRGVHVTAFKCGPDYIDPMFHETAIGIPSGNLDPYFAEPDVNRYLYARHSDGFDFAVVEGVMGYYDGIGGASVDCSTYELAEALEIPVILVVACHGMGTSASAVVGGILSYRTPSHIRGVILNGVSASFYPQLKELLERETGVKVLGYLPRLSGAALESRHLGLVTPGEVRDIWERLSLLAETARRTMDLDKLLALGESAAMERVPKPDQGGRARRADVSGGYTAHSPLVAVARDEAFCFHYRDNLKLLEDMGARLAFFSPLREDCLPKGACGLWLPGGYPELYAGRLSDNRSMLQCVRLAAEGGMPLIAECGGFLYLHEALEDREGTVYPMASVYPGTARRENHLQRFGYIRLECLEDNLLLRAGEHVLSHEFHYWTAPDCGASCRAVKASGRGEWSCVHGSARRFAGFPHLYLCGKPRMARRFLLACEEYYNDVCGNRP